MKSPPPIPLCSKENFCFHVGDYSFGFNGKDKESEFNSGAYDFGARIHDARLGRWMSVDELTKLYTSVSPFVFCLNSPNVYIDPDGRKIIPTAEFLSSRWGPLYSNLANSNSVYQAILKKYKDSAARNVELHTDEKEEFVSKTGNAITYSKQTIKTAESGSKFVSRIEGNQYFKLRTREKNEMRDGALVKVVYDRTDIALVKTIIHEAIHSSNAMRVNASDPSHDLWAESRNLLVDALMEYSNDNSLGYTREQMEILSWEGADKSKQFKNYINGRAAAAGTDFETEENKFNKEFHEIAFKKEGVVKSEESSESESAPADSTGTEKK